MDYRKEPLMKYIEDAAAARPTPGGGSVAAVAAALASTMASMAAGFTAGKEKYRDVQDDIADAIAQLADLRERLLGLAHRDMDAFAGFMAACRLPKETEAEKTVRAAAVTRATRASLDVVEGVLDGARKILEVDRRLADIANRNLLSDVGVAAELALGAVRASRINAEVNLAGYGDGDHAAAVRKRVDEAVTEAERLARETRQAVLKAMAK